MQKQPKWSGHARRGVYDHEPLPDRFALRARDFYLMDDSPIVSLHYHDITELGYCYEGSGIFVVGSKILPFAAGDVSVISPGEMHLAQSHRGTRSLWTFVFLDVAGLLLPRFPELASFDITAFSGVHFRNIISPGGQPELNQSVRTLIQEIRHKRPLHRVVILSHLAVVAAQLSRNLPEPAPARPASAAPPARPASARPAPARRRSVGPLKAALEHIARNYFAPIPTPELARMCGMSSRNFSRRFAEAVGCSPHRYVTDTRVAMACGQLANANVAVGRIAEDCGFMTISSFNRAFKARTGKAPREWRKKGAHGPGVVRPAHPTRPSHPTLPVHSARPIRSSRPGRDR